MVDDKCQKTGRHSFSTNLVGLGISETLITKSTGHSITDKSQAVLKGYVQLSYTEAAARVATTVKSALAFDHEFLADRYEFN